MDDEPDKPFQVKAMPDDMKRSLRHIAWDAGVSMSQVVLDILAGRRPPITRR